MYIDKDELRAYIGTYYCESTPENDTILDSIISVGAGIITALVGDLTLKPRVDMVSHYDIMGDMVLLECMNVTSVEKVDGMPILTSADVFSIMPPNNRKVWIYNI